MKIGEQKPIDLAQTPYMAEILLILDEQGAMSTSELKDEMNLQSTKKPNYAFDRLEENGFVTTRKDTGEYPYIAPKVGEITHEGRVLVENHTFEEFLAETEDSLKNRLERLETKVEKQEQYIDVLNAYLVEEVKVDVTEYAKENGFDF